MNLNDTTLAALVASLTPADRARLAECLREGATLTDDAKSILRWLRRRLKRRARSKR